MLVCRNLCRRLLFEALRHLFQVRHQDVDDQLIRFDYLMKALDEFKEPKIKILSNKKLTGKEYGDVLFKARASHLVAWINTNKQSNQDF